MRAYFFTFHVIRRRSYENTKYTIVLTDNTNTFVQILFKSKNYSEMKKYIKKQDEKGFKSSKYAQLHYKKSENSI